MVVATPAGQSVDEQQHGHVEGRLDASGDHQAAVLPPPAAMFAIPTHATTHASSAFNDAVEDVGSDFVTLQGRPLPTAMAAEGASLPLDYFAHDNESFLASGSMLPPFNPSTSHAPSMPWRTANTILTKDLTNIDLLRDTVLKPTPLPSMLPSPGADIHSSASPYVNPSSESQETQSRKLRQRLQNFQQQQQRPQAADHPVQEEQRAPPRYRRGKFMTPVDQIPRSGLPPDALPSPTAPQGGRFPRWRGWLEKRALERHYQQMEAVANLSPSARARLAEADVQRKKSWGAAVDDADAVSETTDQDQDIPFRRNLPLHIHHFGSRFIPHLPSLPLCAVALDLPPPQSWSTARLLRRSTPQASKRRVLLVGTGDGLYVIETRRGRRTDDLSWADSVQRKERERYAGHAAKRESGRGEWNEDVRVSQVWTGIGIFQMSILSPQAPELDTTRIGISSFTTKPNTAPQDAGILLALCSSKKEHGKTSSTYNLTSSTSHSDLQHASNASVTSGNPAQLSTAYVGTGGGGGKSKPTPPHGTGDVRMWNIEAIRRVVAYTLDAHDSRPLDMLRTSRSATKRGNAKPSSLASRIRKAWAHLGDPSSERKRMSRQYSSESASPVSPQAIEASMMRFSFSADRPRTGDETGPRIPSHARSKSEHVLSKASTSAEGAQDDLQQQLPDGPYQESLRLALSWVPISLPGSFHHPPSGVSLGRTDSISSLFSEEPHATGAMSGFYGSGSTHPSAAYAAQTSASLPNLPPMTHGKGVSFYAIIEAGPEVQGAGTWYLAMAQGKSIMLYESVKPISRGDARSWAFVKEFYTPVQPKGMTFCFCESPDGEELSRASFSSAATGSTATARRGLKAQRSVKSSAYSSVFRGHPDLTLFVALGKKAVLIRANDGFVKEIELCPTERATIAEDDAAIGASELGHNMTSKASQGHATSMSSHHRRPSDTPENLSSAHQSGKEPWVGFERVISQVIIRCKSAEPLDEGRVCATYSPTYGAADEDEEDWDSDEARSIEDREMQNAGNGGKAGVLLRDTPLPPGGVSSLLRRPRRAQIPSYTIYSGLAVLTKGMESHILPLPLPRDLYQPRPLDVIHWSAIPSAVTASSRVIGLERDLSSGAIPVGSLGRGKRASQLADGKVAGPESEPGAQANKSSKVILHVVVVLLATLPSRIEMKRVRIRLPVRMPFAFRRDSELELEPISVPFSTSSTSAYEDEQAAGGSVDENGEDGQSTAQAHQELEYLCGMLLPTQFDRASTKPWQAAGDGGAWAFDWRGADDFRIFYAGTQI